MLGKEVIYGERGAQDLVCGSFQRTWSQGQEYHYPHVSDPGEDGNALAFLWTVSNDFPERFLSLSVRWT